MYIQWLVLLITAHAEIIEGLTTVNCEDVIIASFKRESETFSTKLNLPPVTTRQMIQGGYVLCGWSSYFQKQRKYPHIC